MFSVRITGIREAIERLERLKTENRLKANRIMRLAVKMTAQYVIKSPDGANRHTPAYTGNMLENWYITLTNQHAAYQENDYYRKRMPLAGENVTSLYGFQPFTYEQLADRKLRELAQRVKNITFNSRVKLINMAPYQAVAHDVVEGVGVTGQHFRQTLRPENYPAVIQADLDKFVAELMPALTAAVMAGRKRITIGMLSEEFEID